MKSKVLILYSWLVKTSTFFLPEAPVFQAFRGFLYGLGMRRCGTNFKVSANVILARLDLLYVENNVYFANNCVVTGGGEIHIGNNVLIGPNVVISSSNHGFNGLNYLGPYIIGKVIIEDNCWIGANSTLLKNTKIPTSSVVGAGSVCNKDYQTKYSLIAGVPAKIIKSMTPS